MKCGVKVTGCPGQRGEPGIGGLQGTRGSTGPPGPLLVPGCQNPFVVTGTSEFVATPMAGVSGSGPGFTYEYIDSETVEITFTVGERTKAISITPNINISVPDPSVRYWITEVGEDTITFTAEEDITRFSFYAIRCGE